MEAATSKRHPSERARTPEERDVELDHALLGTFPASDPPSITSTIVPGNPPRRDRF